MQSPGIAAISSDSPRLWVFTLEARPLHDSPDFAEAGGAFITCYLRPGFAPDPMRRAVEFVREQKWEVIAVEDEPLQIERHDAPEAEHFDQALVDDEVYVFHQWPVDDADDQTRH
ncbi:MAG: hypothetical protein DI562_17495 [Stenotrophomonas acidaminiphila]|uniref:hypothetical protein n=1 Tax=Pseudoxanthomonas sp. TaxID=1871049 RepID=UPI000DB7AB8E|nr:hypothetical protein [Pseudoxanthomonas sp.]NCT70094.1 hypothetical protein [Xanthomonadaceae bacterium]PZQ24881.1 MAG: hypothetical protein DI562_17495 [Stenotrophomonas acidaminiphila]